MIWESILMLLSQKPIYIHDMLSEEGRPKISSSLDWNQLYHVQVVEILTSWL
jgi:hypothetical protein